MVVVEEFKQSDISELLGLIHYTIRKCYPQIYAPEVVSYFLEYHSEPEILRRLKTAKYLVIKKDGEIIASGFLDADEMGGVYVHPDFQRSGLGSDIVRSLLKLAMENKVKKVWLDATPIAKKMYENLGFQLVRPAVQMVGDVPLDYFIMEKYIN
jgi:ribosomal protein S18 acetylase RimI-like enzyme